MNDASKVNGRMIKLIAYDDGYEPQNAVANTTKMIKEDGVFCLLGNVGTPTALAIRKMLAEEKVPLFAPFTGAESLRIPVAKGTYTRNFENVNAALDMIQSVKP